MTKAWRIIGTIALLCLLVGILGVGVGFFMGSSPVVLQNHGNLAGYIERLTINGNILKQMAAGWLGWLG